MWSLSCIQPNKCISILCFRIDDIQDNSILRRGIPVAHSIYGVASTINAANYVFFLALEKVQALGHPRVVLFFNYHSKLTLIFIHNVLWFFWTKYLIHSCKTSLLNVLYLSLLVCHNYYMSIFWLHHFVIITIRLEHKRLHCWA